MSMQTFSYIILLRSSLQKLLLSNKNPDFEFICFAHDLSKINNNLRMLETPRNQNIDLHKYEGDNDEYREINFYLKAKNFSYQNEHGHSKIMLSIYHYDQDKVRVLDTEIIIRLYFPASWGTEYTEVLEQKQEVIQLMSYLKPEFGFTTNEYEIERIYNTSYMDLIRFGRDWAIISKETAKLARKEIDLDEKFKNVLDLGKLVWLDNL
jgi:hypothetical protein